MTAKAKYSLVTLVVLAGVMTMTPGVAHAYIDPGSGLLVYQSLTAFATGVMFYFRRRLKNFFFKDRGGAGKPEGTA